MAGRAPHKVFEYDLEGNYIQSYDNIHLVRAKYYPDDLGTRPIFVKQELGEDYHITAIGTILVKNRIGRDNIKFLLRRVQSEYSYLSLWEDRPVEVYNIRGEKLAEFPNALVCAKLMPYIDYGTIMRHLRSPRKSRYYKGLDLTFKYKE